jgi:serine/threonine-protein kinase ATR
MGCLVNRWLEAWLGYTRLPSEFFVIILRQYLTECRACFNTLNDADRCKAIEYLGRIPCASSGYLTVTRVDGKIVKTKCLLCEGMELPDSVGRDEHMWQDISQDAILTFSNLVKSAAFLDSRRPRVLAMLALRRFALHYDDSELLDLEVSYLGQWCLSSLSSSIRELRVAAG